MADNETIDNGALTDYGVAADRVTYSGDADVLVQLARLVQTTGAEGSKTVVDLPGDATNGLDVDVTRVIPGTTATALGKAEDAAHADGDTGVLMLAVRNYAGAGTDGDYTALSATPTGELRTAAHKDALRIAVQSGGLTIATTAYVAGDQVGTQFTFASAARASGGTGIITGVTLTDAKSIIGAYDVVICRASVTPAADNAAFTISAADTRNVIAVVQLTGAQDLGSGNMAGAFNLAIPYDCSGGTSLYALLICRFGHTFFTAVTDLELSLFVERN